MNIKELESKCASAFKCKKAVIVKAAMALGNYVLGESTLGDGLLKFGSYAEGEELVYEGDTNDLILFKGDFAVTACQRSFSPEGLVTMLVRDDRPGKNTSKILLYNSDQDVSRFLHHLNDNLKLGLDSDIAELDAKIKDAFKCKKAMITKLAMDVANYKSPDGTVFGDSLFCMTDYDFSEGVNAVGSTNELYTFKNNFVVTACQRVVNNDGMASLVIRDDRAGKSRSKQLLFNGDQEVIGFMKFMETVLGHQL